MYRLQRNYEVIRNWARFETGPLTVILSFKVAKQLTLIGLVVPLDAVGNDAINKICFKKCIVQK